MNYSLDEKIGQMIMVGFRGPEISSDSPIVNVICNYHLGGVWLTDNDSPMGITTGNIVSATQLKNLVSDLQNYARIPLFISIDAEGGQVIRLKEKFGFPKTYSAQFLGEQPDFEMAVNQSRMIAALLYDLGINFNFSPVLDLALDVENPALAKKERCFSADAHRVTQYGKIVIEAHREKNILCCLKHFPGHGSTAHDSHAGLVDASETWSAVELIPFRNLIQSGLADAVLTAHLILRQYDKKYPATLSAKIISGLLRREFKFNGLVISDDLNMRAISAEYPYDQAIELAVNAGVDILLQSNFENYREDIAIKTHSILTELVRQGKISEERIDQSFRRIIKLKKYLM